MEEKSPTAPDQDSSAHPGKPGRQPRDARRLVRSVILTVGLLILVVWVLVYMIGLEFGIYLPGMLQSASSFGLTVGLVVSMGAVTWKALSTIWWGSAETEDLQRRRDAVEAADENVRRVLGDTDFGTLWSENRQRLDLYHDLALQQSRRSFWHGQGAAILGLLILGVCVAVAFQAASVAAAVSIAALGASGAALSGYIGGTFLRTQAVASQQLRDYFNQPLQSSRYLAAERILDTIEDPRVREEAAAELLKAIVATQADTTGKPSDA